jgi:hypothetical protein
MLRRMGRPLSAARRWVTSLLVITALAGASGCATKPTANVHHAEIRGVSPYGLGVEVFLSVRNENSFDIQIRRVRANALIGNRYNMPVNVTLNRWLSSDNTTIVIVPLSIPWQIVPGLIAESVGSPFIHYRIRGTADVTATRMFGVDRDDFPLDEVGVIPRDVMIAAARNVIPL